MSLASRPKFRLSRLFWAGATLLVLGSAPLLAVIVLASCGLTTDPNPNPVGFGILFALAFWPSVILMAVGATRSYRRYRAAQSLFNTQI